MKRKPLHTLITVRRNEDSDLLDFNLKGFVDNCKVIEVDDQGEDALIGILRLLVIATESARMARDGVSHEEIMRLMNERGPDPLDIHLN